MTDQARSPAAPASARRLAGAMILGAALLAGCHGTVGGTTGGGNSTGNPGVGNSTGNPGAGGAGNTVTGQGGAGNTTVTGQGGAGAGTAMCTPTATTACTGTELLASKRVVRLTFNQITSAIRAVFTAQVNATVGNTIADKIVNNPAYEMVDAAHRTFPPLSNPREGAVLTDDVWYKGDQMAQEAAKYVFDNFATITLCTGTNITDTCAQNFVRAFAAKIYRRPLDANETTDINKVYTDVKGFGGTIQEATQYAVYSAFASPSFLYRSEIGTSGTAMGNLTQYELASAISFFLTDGPPDATLQTAAQMNQLTTDAQIRTHVNRIIATPAAKANLEGAMMSYFAIPTIETIVIDTGTFPNWGPGLRNSMYHEAELFLQSTLWTGKVADLLTSRKTFVNTTLAPVYGIPAPAGATTEADFIAVTLPDTRAGMLTMPGFLVARARPMAGSVIGRGLLVNATFLCNQNPEFPDELSDQISAANSLLASATEKEKAAYRADTSRACAACHPNFDAYGLALENFDTIGGFRTMDDMGRPVDASVVLPPRAGCGQATGAASMAMLLAQGGAFAKCITKNVMSYALAEVTVGVGTESCATRNVVDKFNAAGELTFTSLIREIAASPTLVARNAGGAQ